MMRVREALLFALALMVPIGKANAQDADFFNLRVVCDSPSTHCTKFKSPYEPYASEDVFVDNSSVANLKNIGSAKDDFRTVVVSPPPHQNSLMMQYDPKKETVSVHNDYFVRLTFKDPKFLENITTQNVNKHIGVFINNNLVSTPRITEPISSGSMEISAKTQDEAKKLAVKINNEIAALGK
jgi:preprotein translocase subunit SecD